MPNRVAGIHGDTYPTTWAGDGATYLSSGDPNWALFDGVPRHVPWPEAIADPQLYPRAGGLDLERLDGLGADIAISQVDAMPAFMGPGGQGAKPSGLISVGGVLHLAVQNLLGWKPSPLRPASQHGSDATIISSRDGGRTWTPDLALVLTAMEAEQYDRPAWRWRTPPETRDGYRGWRPMFPGHVFGGPTFMQCGRDHADAPDGMVYAASVDQWDNGGALRIGRVDAARVGERAAWTFAVPRPDGGADWIGDPEQAPPALSIPGYLSLPELVWLPRLRRCLLLTWSLHRDFDATGGSRLTVLESPTPWGPYALVHHEERWDEIAVCPYCPRIPLRWFDQDRLTGWLLHSGSWHGTEHYRAHARGFALETA